MWIKIKKEKNRGIEKRLSIAMLSGFETDWNLEQYINQREWCCNSSKQALLFISKIYFLPL